MKGLIGKLMGSFTDDKGLFQGGEEGRFLGRQRDKMEGRGTSYDPSMAKDQDLWGHAKDFAGSFDAESSDDVLELQGLMNQLGITDEEGGSFKEDAILGSKTMQGLRQLQGRDDNAYRAGPRAPEEWANEGSSPMSWVQKLFGGAKGQTRRARSRMFKPESSGDYAGVKYKKR